RHQQHAGERDADQHPEVELLVEVAETPESLGERDGEQEREQDLHAGERHPQLLEQVREVAIRALLLGFVPSASGSFDHSYLVVIAMIPSTMPATQAISAIPASIPVAVARTG